MSETSGYKRWASAVTKAMQVLVRDMAKDKKRNRQVGQSLMNRLLGEPEPGVDPAPVTPLGRFQADLFYGYAEIVKSVDALKNIEIYIAVFPYAKKKVSRSEHLAYHYSNYLQELYVLRERLQAHQTFITRAYRKDPRFSRVKSAMAALEDMISRSLDPIIGVRSNHVHKSRFEHDDFRRLTLIELFQKSPITDDGKDEFTKLLPEYYKSTYRDLRKKWLAIIKENNKAIATLLDVFGTGIIHAIFTGPGDELNAPAVVEPRRARSSPQVPSGGTSAR